jgi:uncharacterized protein (UPF0332 family)
MFQWRDYISLAKGLLKAEGIDEARYRSIISRAYYGAFHLAKDHFCPHITIQRGGDSHLAVITEVRIQDATCYDILDDLRNLRQRADYDASSFPTAQKEATMAIRRAEQLAKIVGAV